MKDLSTLFVSVFHARSTVEVKQHELNILNWICVLLVLLAIIRNSTMNERINKEWERFAPIFLNLRRAERSFKLLQDIREYYLNNSDIGILTIKASAAMLSDRGFFLDNHDAAVLHAKVAPVYAYYYNYNGRYAMAKLLFVKSPLPFPIPDRYDFAIGTAINWFAENVLRFREPNRFGKIVKSESSYFTMK
jgi:hypothetical protein